jgi:hypothetical protein
MFQSIKYIRALGYNAATKLHSYEYELIDSDFSCVVVVAGAREFLGMDVLFVAYAGAVIKEYSKRKLNIAANLIRFFRFYKKKWSYSMIQQIAWAEKYQPAFTPKLKAELDKYLILV